MSTQAPTIYAYLDWRAYLADWVHWARATGKHSERKFAERAGLRSPSFLKLLLDGKRAPTLKSAKAIAKGLALSLAETKYFETLVLFGRANATAMKALYYNQLLALRDKNGLHDISADQFRYFSGPHLVILRELLAMPKFSKAPPAKLASTLEISEAAVIDGLETLQRLGLVKFHTSTRRYEVVNLALQTSPEVQSLLIRTFHKQMIERALQSLDAVPLSRREVGALTFSLNATNYAQVVQRIRDFRRALNQEFSGIPDSDLVYQLNFQLFPLVDVSEGEVA